MSDIRNKWFSMLSNLTYPLDPGQAATAFKPYLILLSDLPDAAFTRGSLEAVCEAPHKMALRSYDEISTPLRAWWRDNRPFLPALPAPVIPDRVPPTEAELAHAKASMHACVELLQKGGHPEAEPVKVKPNYLSDGNLLAAWQQLADEGKPFAQIRVDAIKARMQENHA